MITAGDKYTCIEPADSHLRSARVILQAVNVINNDDSRLEYTLMRVNEDGSVEDEHHEIVKPSGLAHIHLRRIEEIKEKSLSNKPPSLSSLWR